MAGFLPDLPSEHATALCALGEGSIGRVLQLVKHDGLAVARSFRDFFLAIADQDRKTIVAAAANVAPGPVLDEEQFRVASHILFWWLRRIARACLSGSPAVSSSALAPRGEKTTATEGLAAAGTLDHWLKVWDKSHRLAAQADTGNLDRKQVLTTILLEVQRDLHLARF